MSMQKTLGGDRLGAGKKMKVSLHGYERSTHDMGYIWRSTMSQGTLVPFLVEVALPGDTFDINLACEMMTHPTVGPLFSSSKVQLDVFQAPIRLYQGQLHNNKLGIGMKMSDIKLPQIELAANPLPAQITGSEDIDNWQINPSCILSYLGIRGVLNTINTGKKRTFNGIPLLAYWDIYKNYYSNKQEEIGAVIHRPKDVVLQTIASIRITNDKGQTFTTIPKVPPGTPVTISITYQSTIAIDNTPSVEYNPSHIQINLAGSNNLYRLTDIFEEVFYPGTGIITYLNKPKLEFQATTITGWNYVNPDEVPQISEPKVSTFPLENIDTMRESILGNAGTMGVPFMVSNENYPPYNWLLKPDGNYHSKLSSQEGLALKTYQSDLFNNWLSTEWIDGADGISEITSIDTSGGSFSIDTLNLSKKVYDLLNRIAVSGGTYDDWLDVVYDHDRYTRCESPMYMGGLIKELVFQEVISNSESANQPLGTLGGRGVMSNKHKGGHVTIKVDEPSYIIGLVSITPRLDYSQGTKWDAHLETLDDLHKPGLDQIGFQELLTEQLSWWSTVDDGAGGFTTYSAGKQPAWINYMTNVNQTRGNFAIKDNEMFMTQNRRYEFEQGSLKAIKDLTTYIDPVKFNHIFAQTSLDAQNYWCQIGIDMTARRKMSAKIMPNL